MSTDTTLDALKRSEPAQPVDPAVQAEKRAKICKWVSITILVLAIISAVVVGALAGTGHLPAVKEAFEKFGDWVVNTAVPAVSEFFKQKMTVGALIGAGGVLVIGGASYGIYKCCTKKPDEEEQVQILITGEPREFGTSRSS